MYINTTGLVLRETDYKDSSRILTVLTSTEGKLTVSARGAVRRGSRLAAATQALAYSHMTLSKSRDRYSITEAQTIELFDGLSRELELLALGSYVAELLEAVTDEDSPNPELLSLGLNALFTLSTGDKNPLLVKAAFEMRLMCLSGFEPSLDVCAGCGRADMQEPRLDLCLGTVRCRACRSEGSGPSAVLDASSLDALRYIVSCEPKKLFSFRLPEESLSRLNTATESYVEAQLDRKFKTLAYYKGLK